MDKSFEFVNIRCDQKTLKQLGLITDYLTKRFESSMPVKRSEAIRQAIAHMTQCLKLDNHSQERKKHV